jgi:predicted esterase
VNRILSVETRTHGRVLVRDASGLPIRGLIVAFHGYGQSADTILAELDRVPGISAWTVVSVQALHRFYARGDQAVIASWMTRQDRDQAIVDNVAYVDRAMDAALQGQSPGSSPPPPIVCVGFSQGAAMAYRAAVLGTRKSAAVIVLGGDVPPDLDLIGAPPVLIGVGARDTWYTVEKVRADTARLEAAGVSHEVVTFAGGHEWTDQFRVAIARWLDRAQA